MRFLIEKEEDDEEENENLLCQIMAYEKMAAPVNFQQELETVRAGMDRLIRQEWLLRSVTPEYLAQAVAAYPQRGGKRLRAALVLWSCGLAGGDPAKARHAALAVELFHNWSLVHDDIIDDDAARRGQPSCHVLLAAAPGRFGARLTAEQKRIFGRNQAILAGDVQLGWAIHVLSRTAADGVPPEIILTLIRQLSGPVTAGLVGGEARDIEFSVRRSVTPAAIRSMMRDKTGLLLAFAAQAGAMIGLESTNFNQPLVARLGRFALKAALAFQLQDDLLGIFGEEKITGKPAGSDLREGKKTLLLVDALTTTAPAERRILASLAGKKNLTLRELRTAQTIIRQSGVEMRVAKEAGRYLSEARRLLAGCPANPYRDLLTAWLDSLARRQA